MSPTLELAVLERTAEMPPSEIPVADDLSLEGCESQSLPVAVTSQNGRTKRIRTRAKSEAPSQTEKNLLWEIRLLPTGQIGPNPFQPRQEFSEEEMEELAASVAEHGVQTPVLVRTAKPVALEESASEAAATALPTKKTRAGKREKVQLGSVQSSNENISVEASGATTPFFPFELVTGERRLRASVKAGRPFIPAIVRDDLTDAQAAELALVENVQRSNLNIIEEGRGYKRLMLRFRYTEARIAKKVGKSIATIQAAIKLLELPEEVQTMLLKKQLTASHGHELLKLAPFPEICVLVALKAFAEKISAASLGQNPLPITQQLKRRGTVVELGYGTKFDWKSECKNCPFKAFVTSGYGSYCLKPAEWRAKQDHAIEMEKQEAARVLEAARQEGDATVDVSDLPIGSYRSFQWNEPPAGCSPQCACRGQVSDPRDAAKSIPVCLNPERLEELRKAQRQAEEIERKRRYQGMWETSLQCLSTSTQSADGLLSVSTAPLESQSNGFKHHEFEDSQVQDSPNGLSDESVENSVGEAYIEPAISSGEVSLVNNDFPNDAGSGEDGIDIFASVNWNKVAPLLVLPILRGENRSYSERGGWEEKAREMTLRLGLELPWNAIMDDDEEGDLLLMLELLPPLQLLYLGAMLILTQEAIYAGHWAGPTPFMDFVLGLRPAQQSELEMNESEDNETEGHEVSGEETPGDAVEFSDAGEETTEIYGENVSVVVSESSLDGAEDRDLDKDEMMIAMLESEQEDDHQDNDHWVDELPEDKD